MINVFIIMFVVIFEYQGGEFRKMELEMESVEQCFEQKAKVDADPTELYYEGKKIVNLHKY